MAAACNRNGDFNNNAAQDHEASSVNKYGGIVPKRKPLISKDHERAFFDSADWALCKQGVGGVTSKTTVTMETLQPKLQRTEHQQLPPRRPALRCKVNHWTKHEIVHDVALSIHNYTFMSTTQGDKNVQM
ncbi:Endosulphine [Heracleum sosnowskyi]|uniref:Endosulphine n=1 Tax=Heracleum sosnowskyi TaxID=360622 RepID=A0AAD8IJ90_9APIA|nr:Endosulphine [Heracleum sosnowskyi]